MNVSSCALAPRSSALAAATERRRGRHLAHLGRLGLGFASAFGLGFAGFGCSISEYFVTGASATGDTDTDTDGPAPCSNGVQEPWESDVDCGGPICEPCGVDRGCKVDADCDTAICAAGLCSDTICDLPNPCPLVTAPCLTMRCDPEFGCLLEPVADGDPCGGGDLPAEPPPPAGICEGGVCLAPCGPCEPLNGPCREGVCDPITGECLALWAEDNTPCAEEQGMAEGLCFQGECEAPIQDSVLFFADFEGQGSGFDADEPWEIGPALPSLCSKQRIDDPATDVDNENGALAGLLIGECLPASSFPKSCLTSPMIEVPFPGSLSLRYWEVVDLPPQVTRGTIELRIGGGDWAEIHETTPELAEWTQQVVELGPVEAPELQLRFCFETGGEIDSYSGWSVDTIEITCNECAP